MTYKYHFQYTVKQGEYNTTFRLGDIIQVDTIEYEVINIVTYDLHVDIRLKCDDIEFDMSFLDLSSLVNNYAKTGWFHLHMNEPIAEYHSDCPACFGGMPHTQRQCNRNVSRSRKASR